MQVRSSPARWVKGSIAAAAAIGRSCGSDLILSPGTAHASGQPKNKKKKRERVARVQESKSCQDSKLSPSPWFYQKDCKGWKRSQGFSLTVRFNVQSCCVLEVSAVPPTLGENIASEQRRDLPLCVPESLEPRDGSLRKARQVSRSKAISAACPRKESGF